MKSLRIILSTILVVLCIILIQSSAQARHRVRFNLGIPQYQHYGYNPYGQYVDPSQLYHYGWHRGFHWGPAEGWHWGRHYGLHDLEHHFDNDGHCD